MVVVYVFMLNCATFWPPPCPFPASFPHLHAIPFLDGSATEPFGRILVNRSPFRPFYLRFVLIYVLYLFCIQWLDCSPISKN